MLKTLQGHASAWLLSLPSNRRINRASLAAAFAICLALLAATISLSFAQWILSEHLQLIRIEREQRLSLQSEISLKMAMSASNAHRATIGSLVARDSLEMSDSRQRRQTALDDYDSGINSTEGNLSPETEKKKEAAFALAKNYRALSAQLLEMVQNGELQEALDFRLERLRPLFEEWQVAHNEFAQSLTREILQNDALEIQTIQILRCILFALIIAPVALITICTLAVFAILGIGYLNRKHQTQLDPWSH